MRSTIRRAVIVAATAALSVGVAAGTASAHIEPDPAAAQEGTAVTVGFTVEHGCAGSPTTGLDIKLPDGIADAEAVDKAGWTGTVDAGVVRFSGGPSPSGEASDVFSISFTAPATPGDVHFPTVQTCVQGSVDWLDVAHVGQADADHPAPTIRITAGPPTSGDLTPAPDDGADGADAGHPGTDHAGTAGTAVAATAPAASAVGDTAAASTSPVTATVTTSTFGGGGGGGGNTGLIVGIVIAAVVVVGGGGLLAARARRNRPAP